MIRATVITDASFYKKDGKPPNSPGVAGWAAWVRVDGIARPIKGYGAITKGACINSTDAEIYAALNGIWLASHNGGQHILVRSDCMAVQHCIRGQINSKRMHEIWSGGLAKLNLEGVQLEARHVKGHGRIVDKATWVNDWVDDKAGYAQRQARKGKTCLWIS